MRPALAAIMPAVSGIGTLLSPPAGDVSWLRPSYSLPQSVEGLQPRVHAVPMRRCGIQRDERGWNGCGRRLSNELGHLRRQRGTYGALGCTTGTESTHVPPQRGSCLQLSPQTETRAKDARTQCHALLSTWHATWKGRDICITQPQHSGAGAHDSPLANTPLATTPARGTLRMRGEHTRHRELRHQKGHVGAEGSRREWLGEHVTRILSEVLTCFTVSSPSAWYSRTLK